MARVVRATLQAHLCLVSQSARGRLPKKSTHFSADTKRHFPSTGAQLWSRRETYTPLERSKRRPVPSELQACAHLRSQPPCAPNCTAPQLPPTSSASHPPCLPSPCTSPLHLTPLGPWRLSRTWRVPRCGGRVPCRGRARCSGRVVRRGREARRGLGSCSPLASARRTTADGRALVLGQQLLRELGLVETELDLLGESCRPAHARTPDTL